MYGKAHVVSTTLNGVEAIPVDVEVVVSNGLPSFSIVGMPDTSISEARERIKAAIRDSGFVMPGDKIVVNLSPASIRKTGSGFDLPIALALLVATGQISPAIVEGRMICGELTLTGEVRSLPGLLPGALCAKNYGYSFLCPRATELLSAFGVVEIRTIERLSEIRYGEFPVLQGSKSEHKRAALDYSDIYGHDFAKRALQIAATGNHGILMMGPPGSGKTMLASRVPTIMPELSESEILEVSVIHSIAGEAIESILSGDAPFRSPHHTTSTPGLVGGSNPPKPGEVTLAHRGVLFLDELSEFNSATLQSLRQPLENGVITITRSDSRIDFPAQFLLVCASNPCPCGYFGDREHSCRCTPKTVRDYQLRIGGPLSDRIDIQIPVERTDTADILKSGQGTSSAFLREGVCLGREFRSYRESRETQNGGAPPDVISSCRLDDECLDYFKHATQLKKLSGRGVVRTLSVARTIADIDQSERVERRHLSEALGYRMREVGV